MLALQLTTLISFPEIIRGATVFIGSKTCKKGNYKELLTNFITWSCIEGPWARAFNVDSIPETNLRSKQTKAMCIKNDLGTKTTDTKMID